MVVDHPDCLHVPVNHGGSDEAESTPLEIAAERVGLPCGGGDLPHGVPTILSRAALDELPGIQVKAAALLLHPQKRARGLHPGGALHAVAYDAKTSGVSTY